MKRLIHIPTLLLHGCLLIVVTQTLEHYPDLPLWIGGIGLTVHLVLSVLRVKNGAAALPIYSSHLLGCIIQSEVLNRPQFLHTGLGSGLAHFFYQVALVLSLILLALALFLAFALRKEPTE